MDRKNYSFPIRAAFYTPWNYNASTPSLKNYGDKINVIFSEWFFIDTVKNGSLQTRIDISGLTQMRRRGLKIMPVLTNFNSSKNDFDGNLIHGILTDRQIQQLFIRDLIDTLTHYNFQGINIDFEEIKEPTSEPLSNFQKKPLFGARGQGTYRYTRYCRLGSEDPRIWSFYNLPLSNDDVEKKPFNYSLLQTIPINPNQKPTAVGEGELLNILFSPQQGKIKLETDSVEQLITEQSYLQLPSGYVYQKFAEDTSNIGPGHKIILTFDDGPSDTYTPVILDILKKEKVPATFFIVGLQGEEI